MLKYLLFYIMAAGAVWCKPLPIGNDVSASHIVIVTPQAQVHLEPALKYDTASGTFIHHLAPVARIAAPHEETIVYVPASAAAPIIAPIESVSVVGRASGSDLQPIKSEAKQWEQISQQIQQAVQQGSSQLAPQLSEAATAAAAAASAAGQGLFPALFPSPSGGSASAVASNKLEESKPNLKPSGLVYETPANTEPLLPAQARFYALTPAVSHIVDFVHGPVFVGPLSAVRARSIQPADAESIAAEQLAEAAKPEPQPQALTLKTDSKTLTEAQSENQLHQQSQLQAQPLPQPLALTASEPEKKSEIGRFLEANTLKDDQLKEQEQKQPKQPLGEPAINPNQPLIDSLPAASQKEPLESAKPTLPAEQLTPQLKSAAAPVADVVAVVAKDDVVTVVDVVPQPKVA